MSPGVRYYPDGSGKPDDYEYVPIGTAQTLTGGVEKICHMLVSDVIAITCEQEKGEEWP